MVAMGAIHAARAMLLDAYPAPMTLGDALAFVLVIAVCAAVVLIGAGILERRRQ